MIKFFYFILLFISFSSRLVAVAPPIILEKEKEVYELGLNLDILEDPSGKLSITDVNKGEWANKFKKSTEKIPNFGASSSFFWARFTIQNNLKNNVKWILSQKFFLQDEIEFFKKRKSEWVRIKTGDFYPFSSRDVDSRYFSFNINPQEKSLYFMRIRGMGSQFLLTLSSLKRLHAVETQENFIFGLFFGLVLTMIAYNFFIFLSTKSLSYLYYVIFVIFCGSVMGVLMGFTQRFLFQETPWFSNNGLFFLVFCVSLSITLFTISLLKLKESTPKLYKMARLCCLVSSLGIVSSLTLPLTVNFFLVVIVAVCVPSFLTFAGVYRTKMNYRPAKYFILAFTLLFLGCIIFVLAVTGNFPNTFLTRHGIIFGSALQMILLSMGLADQFNLIQENYSKDLEKEVNLKTKQVVMEKERAESSEKDVSELLHNMGQSVFSVNKEGHIIPPVSQYSFELFGKSIDNQSVYETLYKDMDQEGEKFLKAKFAIGLSVGVDSLQYEMSYDQLPHHLMMFNKNKEERSLKINYSPIIDKFDIVQKIMLIVEDVTEFEKLEREAKEVQEKSDIKIKKLQEIVSNDKKDLRLFSREVGLNLELAKSSLEKRDMEGLFRAAHTIKGNARIYNLTGLSAEIHLIESEINELMKENFHLEKMKNIEKSIRERVEDYIDLAKEIFGDDVDETILAGDTDEILISKSVFFSSLDELKGLSKEFQNDSLSKILNKLENEEFKKTLSHLHKTVNKMALSLSKDIELKIEGDDIFLDLKMSSMLKDSLMHIIQNSADHGIEEKGMIKIIIRDLKEKIEITISDDGKGIDPEMIYQKGIEKELVKAQDFESCTKEDKLNIILIPGFSTKSVATEFSGRGVGMDVVKSNIEKLKGTIEIDSTLGEGTQFKLSIPY